MNLSISDIKILDKEFLQEVKQRISGEFETKKMINHKYDYDSNTVTNTFSYGANPTHNLSEVVTNEERVLLNRLVSKFNLTQNIAENLSKVIISDILEDVIKEKKNQGRAQHTKDKEDNSIAVLSLLGGLGLFILGGSIGSNVIMFLGMISIIVFLFYAKHL